MPNNFVKTPAGRLDYTWDWSDWLAAASDTISSATVAVPAGLTAVGAPVIDGGDVTQRISGGTVDDTYTMVCQITTTGGQIDEEPIYLTINTH